VATTRPACKGRRAADRRRGLGLVLLLALLSACAPHAPADDLTISTKVKIELLADPRLGAMRLQASTLDGVVTLSGTVPSPADVDRARAAAKRVPGVRAVKSELKIGG
jgi:osmotically-inducible protein OsmY